MKENLNFEVERNSLEIQYDTAVLSGAALAAKLNKLIREGKRGDLYHLEKEFDKKITDLNESINRRIISEVEIFRKLHKEIKSIDDFPESRITRQELEEPYENLNKRRKIELFQKKMVELITALGYEVIKSDSKSITLKKADKVFEIQYLIVPESNEKGQFIEGRVGGSRRIVSLEIKKDDKQICFFESQWIRGCEDTEARKDIYFLLTTIS